MPRNVIFIGDSIANGYFDEENIGWCGRLSQKILQNHSGKFIFNNISQSGDNIADITYRATCELLTRHADIVIINAGINDLRRRVDSNLELDFSEGVRIMYWNKLLDIVNKPGAETVVLELLPTVEERYTTSATLIRRNQDVERYNEIIENICKNRNIKFIKQYAQWKSRNLKELYKDATHPNAKGHQIIADEVYDELVKLKVIG